MYYVFIDEVQYAISREEIKNPENIRLYDVLNGLLRLRNVDIYVTGSNFVDVGAVEIYEKDENDKRRKVNCEIDFVVNKGSKKYYVQSALNIDDPQKSGTELRPLISTNDFFKKIIVTKTYMKSWTDESGILHMGLYEFLLNENALEL
ncbi:MAG: hypothetical protein LUF78_10740 [Clostridiales bacterium]|nr:hypothetical protein [Clostridiales bacterium]